MLDSLVVNDLRAAILTIENRNRHTPRSLAGNTPVAAVGNHIVNTVMSPRRNKFNTVDFLQSLLAEAVNRGEPLRSRAEEGRIFTSPAMRILMLDEF